MQKLLHAINLGDRYEVNARLLPAMVAVLPITTLALGLDLHSGHSIRAIGIGTGLEAVLAVLFSKLGHALGRNLENKCKARWGGLPTTSWLMPEDNSHSEQQKQIWRQAISKLSGLNFDSLIGSGDLDELRRALDDAVSTVRNKIRADKRAELLRQHNIYYGFARNMAGLASSATLLSLLASIVAGVAAYKNFAPVALPAIEVLFFVIAFGFLIQGTQYVCNCADRYAELFLVTATAIADSKIGSRKKMEAPPLKRDD